MNTYYVYVYLDPRKDEFAVTDLNFPHEPFYVGKGKGDRMLHHLTDRSKNSLKIGKIQRIIDAGLQPIIIKFKDNLSEDEAFTLERTLITSIGTKWCIPDIPRGPLCNMTSGGDGFSISEEMKANLSKKMSGSGNPMYGKPRSEEVKQKLREFRKTWVMPEETRKKISDGCAGSKNPRAQSWVVQFPDQTELCVEDLSKFCRDRGIPYQSMHTSFNNQKPITRGKFKGFWLKSRISPQDLSIH